MKIRFLRSWKLVLILAGLPLVDGSLYEPGVNATEETASTTIASAVVPDNPPPSPDAAPAAPTTAPEPVVKLSPGAAEVAKLAQAGLGEDVMLAYISNVNSTFNLGSDQIVYLNDLGVSGTVVKAMIQSDANYDAAAKAWAGANQPPVSPALPDTNAYPSVADDSSAITTPDDAGEYADPGDYAMTDDTDYFYNSLSPYGNWFYVAGAGMCWQPTVCFANHTWQPYCDRGRWVYTDCGWYWQSDYSWGWAAFHYGRWFNSHNHGWVWRPDHVWGPAWVSWRQSGDHCGWAPLPPSAHFVPGTGFLYRGHAVPANYDFGLRAGQFTFIPISRMTDYSPYRYASSASEADRLFSHAMPVNHFSFEHSHVVSRGIDPRQVAMASGIPVRKAEVHENAVNPRGVVLSDRIAKEGNSLMIFRPQLSAPTTTSRLRQSIAPRLHSGPQKSSLKMAPAPTLPVRQSVRVSAVPAGSLVLSGQKTISVPQSSAPRTYPNMNFSHQAPRTMPYHYASGTPETPVEAPQSYYQLNHGARSATPTPETFNGYGREYGYHREEAPRFNSGPSQINIPSHFNVGSRLQGSSAFTVNGGNRIERPAEYHLPENREFGGYGRNNATTHESYGGSRAEHYSERSAESHSGSYSAPSHSYSSSYSAPSHSYSAPASSPSAPATSGHR